MFEVFIRSTAAFEVALDDITMFSTNCSSLKSAAHEDPLASLDKTYPPSPLDCTFDQGSLCQWTLSQSADVKWTVVSQARNFSDTPYDHTTGNGRGKFLTTDNDDPNGAVATLASPNQVQSAEGSCLRFWYFMNGDEVGSLSVLAKTGDASQGVQEIWFHRGDQGNRWIQARVYVNPNGTVVPGDVYWLYIQNSLPNGRSADVRIDDITSHDGPCQATLGLCDFESPSLCGYIPDTTARDVWSWATGEMKVKMKGVTQLQEDHTYGTRAGHYMLMNCGFWSPCGTARLLSPMLPAIKEHCLNMFYFITSGTLRVKLLDREGYVSTLWERSNSTGQVWRSSFIQIQSDLSFQLTFEGVAGQIIALDDISVTPGLCPLLGSCDFESGLCAYSNVRSGDDFDWLVKTASWGDMDHTYGSRRVGHYAYMRSDPPRKITDTTRLNSDLLPPTQGSCLSFYIAPLGSIIGTLNVYMDQVGGGALVSLAAITGIEGSAWTLASYSVVSPIEFSIIIEASVAMPGYSDLGLDDITYTEGLCQGGTTQGFTCGNVTIGLDRICDQIVDCADGLDEMYCGSCSFQQSMCGYQAITSGALSSEQRWKLGNNQSMPDLHLGDDHTLGRPTSSQLYLSNEYRGLSSHRALALVMSPLVASSYQSCQLSFFYKFSGDTCGPLVVYMQIEQERVPIWTMDASSLYMTGVWLHGTVVIGRVLEPFNIVFGGGMGCWHGYISIDDVSFHQCAPPPSSPDPCDPSSQLTCVSGSCVDLSLTCDLSDDCGDGTDELNCGNNSTVCDFESPSMCMWSRDPAMAWPRVRGQTHPPWRDHSTGTFHGHLLYQNSGLATPPRLVSDTLRAARAGDKCTLTFYFLTGGDPRVNLKVMLLPSDTSDPLTLMNQQVIGQNFWNRRVVSLVSMVNFKVVLELSSPMAVDGFVALDDLVLSEGCDLLTSDLPTSTVTPLRPRILDCGPGLTPCGDGSCVSTALVCDLVPDCPGGQDEVGCGQSCDFDQGACGWHDLSTGGLQWGVTYTDSGVNSTGGHMYTSHMEGLYPHFDQAYEPTTTRALLGASPPYLAILSSNPMPPIRRTCSVSFVYFNSGLTSGSLFYRAVYKEAVLTSHMLTTTATQGWVSYQVALGEVLHELGSNLGHTTYIDGGWTLQFVFLTDSPSSKQAAAVDDIQFSQCARDSWDELECDFDTRDSCSWHQSSNDKFDWLVEHSDMEGPHKDLTGKGAGDFLVAQSFGRTRRDTAVVESPYLSGGGPVCVLFWYYMRGSEDGSLTVNVLEVDSRDKQGSLIKGSNREIFRHIGAGPDSWVMGSAEFRSDRRSKVIFTASVSGGMWGNVAVDGIQATNSSCPVFNKCTFESDLCTWRPKDSPKTNSDWTRATPGGGQAGQSTPATDHTTGSPYGHFVMMQTGANTSSGAQATIMTLPLQPPSSSQPKAQCLSLWYHMGGGGGEMTVLLYDTGTLVLTTLVKHQGPLEPIWRHDLISVQAPASPYALQIHGHLFSSSSHIAVDDIELLHGACPPPASCDFDHGMCGFSNLLSVDQFDWVLDVTTGNNGTADGYLTAQIDSGITAGDSAVLVSNPVSGVPECYFTLTFKVKAVDVKALTVPAGLTVYSRGLLQSYATKLKLHDVGMLHTNVWTDVSVLVPYALSQEIIFVYVKPATTDAILSLDQIETIVQCPFTTVPGVTGSGATSRSQATPSRSKVSPSGVSTLTSHRTTVTTKPGLQTTQQGPSSQPTRQSTHNAAPYSKGTTQSGGGAQSSHAEGADDSWQMPVALVSGVVGVCLVVMVIVIIFRRRSRLNGSHNRLMTVEPGKDIPLSTYGSDMDSQRQIKASDLGSSESGYDNPLTIDASGSTFNS